MQRKPAVRQAINKIAQNVFFPFQFNLPWVLYKCKDKHPMQINLDKEEIRMKKWIAIFLAAAVLTVPALALSAVTEPAPFRAEYEGKGRVEIDFRRDATYQNLSVTAADAAGNSQTVTILEVDDDDLTFMIENIQPATDYTFTISGVKLPGDADFGSLTGEITTPAAGETSIQKIDFDAEDGELEIEFAGRVDYDNETVTVTAADGTALEARIIERENDSIEIRVSGVTRGEDYTVTVAGVGEAGSGIFGTVQRTFTAR